MPRVKATTGRPKQTTAMVAAAARPSGSIPRLPNVRVTHSRTMGEKWTRIPSQLFLTIYSVFSIYAWI